MLEELSDMHPSLTVQVGASRSVRCNECMTLCLHVPTRPPGMLFKHEINALTLIRNLYLLTGSSGVPRNFVGGGVGSTNSAEDRGERERVSGGGSCNLVQEISFRIVKF